MIFGVDLHRSSLSVAGVDELGRVQVAVSFGNRPGEHTRLVRLGGEPEYARELKLLADYRRQLTAERTRIVNRLHADLVVVATAPDRAQRRDQGDTLTAHRQDRARPARTSPLGGAGAHR